MYIYIHTYTYTHAYAAEFNVFNWRKNRALGLKIEDSTFLHGCSPESSIPLPTSPKAHPGSKKV